LGCVAAIATSSMVTQMAKGKTFPEAMKIKFSDVEKALGSLPPVKKHCADLAVRALQAAIKNYKV
jgi:nitrogen fixation NifU-like protein